jgi:glycosyltransferase involved in cell wall biosynthesis
MRIAFLAGGSASDRRAWSGTTYYAHKALAKRFEVVTLEMPRMNKALRGLRKIVRPTGIDLIREPLYSAAISAGAARLVTAANPDAVFVLGASHIAAGLCDRFRVFHCSDATFAALVDYHGEFSGLSKRTIWAGNELERRTIQESTAVILASEWAARSARVDYRRTEGVHVVPFGANLDELPAADVWQRSGECSLVFIGVNWFEKGADVAVEAARLLYERGIPVVLHVVGCAPPSDPGALPFVRFHGFLRKQIATEYARLTELVANADFLIVPTRFEAFGIVFCEAAAHGTPTISRQTGGVGTAIEDGVTGALLPDEAGPESYADRIQEIWSDEGRYLEMRRQSFARSRRTLNWDTWGVRVEAIVRNALLPGLEASESVRVRKDVAS